MANKAALHAVNKTDPLGQTTVFGQPLAIAPSILRIEVDVFGTPSAIYSVDVTIDGACHVLATSTRLESNPWRDR